MHVTFLTRKYPPQKGGMETFSYQLGQCFPSEKTVIHHGKKQRDILWAAPRLLFGGWRLRAQTDLYHLGDLVLAPLAPLLKMLTRKPIVATVHALELTYKNTALQMLIDRALPSIDAFVCVSHYTEALLRARGVSEEKISVIGHGIVKPKALQRERARRDLDTALALGAENRPLLVTVGRLVKRKGVAWFLEHVLPQLKDLNPLYLIVSDGPEREHIETIIAEKQLDQYVHLAGKIDEEQLAHAYAGADIFVMPNIAMENDAEGFGFVGIEAASYGAPVLASRLEGIPDAIHDGKNGKLATPEDAAEYERIIREWLTHTQARINFGQSAREYTIHTFQWPAVAKQYEELFTKIMGR